MALNDEHPPSSSGARRWRAAHPDASRIFCLGLSRTGTVSLTAALELLGYPARHYPNDPLTQEELRSGRYRLSILEEVRAHPAVKPGRIARLRARGRARIRGAASRLRASRR